MINVQIFSEKYAEIEGAVYQIEQREDLIQFVKAVLDKAYYSGERICLETVRVNEDKNEYEEVDRWPEKR